MILSASRRTDIPTYYSEWLFNRIRDGYVYVRNPLNVHQISKILLSPDVVDGIVFWTKNPAPMIERLDELKDYIYYFQFTLNPYGQDVEPNIPSKQNIIIPTLQRLSDKIGAERIVWRYDPIILNNKYNIPYHFEFFDKLARRLNRYVRKCTLSFLDLYKNTERNMLHLNLHPIAEEEMITLAQGLSQIAQGYDLSLDTCAEKIDLSDFGISHAHCIDSHLLEQLCGCNLILDKDKNQRMECGCAASIDIGAYNTCLNGCRYCYANFNAILAQTNHSKHNPVSPLLFGEIESNDIIYERKVRSSKDFQEHLY